MYSYEHKICKKFIFSKKVVTFLKYASLPSAFAQATLAALGNVAPIRGLAASHTP